MAQYGGVIKNKSMAEMARIQEADAKLRAEQAKTFVPEAPTQRDLARFVVSRYTAGNCKGLFIVYEAVEDKEGNITRKQIAEGVDIVVAMASIETALRKRVYK